MTAKQNPHSLQSPDGSYYVTLTDGNGVLSPAGGGSTTSQAQANAAAQSWTEATNDPLSVNLSGDLRTIAKVTDGTNISAVKAASTIAAATDPALVTTLSPNSAGIIALGQAIKSSSVPVTIASDQALTVSPVATATGGASYTRIAAGQATTVVKASAGTLYAICLNSAATATNTTNVYDNASGSGTVIATPAVTTATVPTTLTYGPTGITFVNGLTIITAAANGGDMTVVWK